LEKLEKIEKRFGKDFDKKIKRKESIEKSKVKTFFFKTDFGKFLMVLGMVISGSTILFGFGLGLLYALIFSIYAYFIPIWVTVLILLSLVLAFLFIKLLIWLFRMIEAAKTI
jgi:hypothetical protein